MLNSLFVQSVIVVCSDSDVEFWADESDTEWNEAVSSEHIKLNFISLIACTCNHVTFFKGPLGM